MYNRNNNPTKSLSPGLSPLEELRRKAPPTPPTPKCFGHKRRHRDGQEEEKQEVVLVDSNDNDNKNENEEEIPWGDRKLPPKPRSIERQVAIDYAYNNDWQGNTSPRDGSIEVGLANDDDETKLSSKTKDGVLFPKNSPNKKKKKPKIDQDEIVDPRFASLNSTLPTKTDGSDAEEGKETRDDEAEGTRHYCFDAERNQMSTRELLWASSVFLLVALLVIATTAAVMNRNTQASSSENVLKNLVTSKNNNEITTPSPSQTAPNLPPSSSNNGGGGRNKISIQEEWDLVYKAISNNPVTKALLGGSNGSMETPLPRDLYFYDHLVSGMVFSEDTRDWIPKYDEVVDDDETFFAKGATGMSMGGTAGGGGEFGGGSRKSNMTPNQKATAWLLFHDERKDPNESVWRWALASIYFRMGGKKWTFSSKNNSTKWFTSAPLCGWEFISGSTGCEKHKQPAPHLPVELDFDDTNLAGPIALEFALLLLPGTENPSSIEAATTASTSSSNTFVRSITLTDNRLTGTIPGAVFEHLMPSLGKLYLDNNQLTGTVPIELGGLGKPHHPYIYRSLWCHSVLYRFLICFRSFAQLFLRAIPDTLYVQNNDLSGDWPQEFCEFGARTVDDFGLDCDKVECSCCDILQCYYSM
jgi:hypothetical protein